MANKTAFLDLIQPGFTEYKDSWWEPLNSNFDTLDTWASETDQEIKDARFGSTSLSVFLAVAHESNGQLKQTPEVKRAGNSPVYGFMTPTPTIYTLGERIDQVDWETWYGREGFSSTKEMSAFRAPNPKHMVLSGSMDANGYPTWMGYTGASLKIDGSVTPIWMTIGGRLARIRTLKSIPITGSAGTRYVYAKYLPDGDEGKIVVDGRMVSPTPGNGTTSVDLSGYAIYFNDLTRDFWPMKLANTIMAGDLLTLTDSVEAGPYVVKEIIEDTIITGTSTQMTIIGTFPVGGISSVNYMIADPLAVEVGVDTTETPADDKLYLGEVYFDGASIANFSGDTTAIRPRHFRDTFVGEWVQVDIGSGNGTPNLGTPVPGKFETRYNHNLGSDILDITVQASAANDGSAPVEEMSMATIDASSLAVSIANGLGLTKTDTLSYVAASHAADVFNPGTSDATFSQGSFSGGNMPGTINYALNGSVTGSLSGSVYTDKSVIVKWTKNHLWIKNAVLNKFFKDYDGTARTAGYIRVIVRRRG